MPLDHVRVTLLQGVHRLAQQRLLGLIARIEHAFPALVVGHRHNDDRIPGPLGVREGALTVYLNVELQPVQIVERHLLEERAARLHEVLLHRVADEVKRIGAPLRLPGGALDVADRIPVGRPGGQHNQVAEEVGARQLLELKATAREALQQRNVRQEEKRMQGRLLLLHGAAAGRALVQTHEGLPVIREYRMGSYQARRGVATVERRPGGSG